MYTMFHVFENGHTTIIQQIPCTNLVKNGQIQMVEDFDLLYFTMMLFIIPNEVQGDNYLTSS